VPLFWSQQATPLSPKPEILLQQFDPIYEVRLLLLLLLLLGTVLVVLMCP
jgi:hypothetical protein